MQFQNWIGIFGEKYEAHFQLKSKSCKILASFESVIDKGRTDLSC